MKVVKVGEDKDFRHSWWLLTNNSIFAFLIFDLRVCYSLCFILSFVLQIVASFAWIHVCEITRVCEVFSTFLLLATIVFVHIFICFVNFHQAMKISLVYSPILIRKNKPFNKEILKHLKLSLIKQQIIENKSYHLLQVIILKHKIGQKL
jgi:hypothetical protein